jgi:hypothetical protein
VGVKEVRPRDGGGDPRTFPLLQCEKLWGDITAREGLKTAYLLVDRFRAQQLKNPRHLDHWARDGSLDYISHRCVFRKPGR